jgi:hypothetical protein
MIISTNILSEYSKEDFKYIVTPSAEAVSEEILNALGKRYRCLSLIGSYGTGKSSFIYALGKSILGEAEYFPKLTCSGAIVFKSIGQYESLLNQLSSVLKTKPNLDSIFHALKEADSKGKRVYIFLDEFGKVIEYALKNDPKKETYYFQQLAEFINNELNQTVLISALHQSFESYSHSVGSADIAEWEKVSGRFFSITFNEPIEIVAQIVLKYFSDRHVIQDRLVEMTKIATSLNLIPLKFATKELNYGSIGIMDGLTTYVAISLFRKYAQNERSVFSFLNDPSNYGLESFHDSTFQLPELYDYVLNRFAHVIYSTVNPDKLQWEAAERAIQRADSHGELDPEISHRILKTLHLINLFARETGKFNSEELQNLLSKGWRADFKRGLDQLFEKNIIQYINYKGRLTFVEGTDVNLDEELRKAAGKLTLNADYDLELKKLIALDAVVAKQHLFDTGTPRLWFTTIRVDNQKPKELEAVLPTNGLISISFRKGLDTPLEISTFPVVQCICEISDGLKILIERIRKFEIVIEDYKDDVVVRNLVQIELDFASRELKSLFLHHIYKEGTWSYLGKDLKIESSRTLNSSLSKIFSEFYVGHPIIINELINRGKLSASINTARKRLLEGLLHSGGNITFEEGKYPPERMIFDSTLAKEGIISSASPSLSINVNSSYNTYWVVLENTFEESRYQKRPFTDFIDILTSKPFGMKDGLIKFLLSFFLVANKDEFALTHEPTSKFIPYLHIDSLEAMFLKPNEFYIKKYNFDRVPKIAINSLLKFSRIDQTLATERSAFFGIYAQLCRSINQLPTYTKYTTVGLDSKTIKLREAIERATDPEKALLVDMPIGLGFRPLTEQNETEYSSFFNQLENCVADMNSAFPRLVYGLKRKFLENLGVRPSTLEAEKEFLRDLVSTINIEIIGSQTKVVLKRILSPLDDEVLYWKAILDAIAEFNLEGVKDDQVDMVRKKIEVITDAIQSLVGMVGTDATNVGITLTQGDGSSTRKFSKPLTKDEVEKSHIAILTHLNGLDSRTRFNLLTYFIQQEL